MRKRLRQSQQLDAQQLNSQLLNSGFKKFGGTGMSGAARSDADADLVALRVGEHGERRLPIEDFAARRDRRRDPLLGELLRER